MEKFLPLIIVGIDNTGERNCPKEYLSFPDDAPTSPTPVVNGNGYPRFLLDEVMPLINTIEFRTGTNLKSTGLDGFSYGAEIVLYAVVTHPWTFGKMLLESRSVDAHDNFLLREAGQFRRWPKGVCGCWNGQRIGR